MSSKGKKPSSVSNTNKKNKKQAEPLGIAIPKYIITIMVSVYVFLMLVVYPLYKENNYIDMGFAKYHFFLWVSLIFLIPTLLSFIVWMFSTLYEQKNNTPYSKKITDTIKLNPTFISVLVFLIASSLSFMLIDNPANDLHTAFFGFPGWYMGYLSQATFVFTFLFIGYFWEWSPFTIITALISGTIVYLIAVLQRFDFDIFGLYTYVTDEGIVAELDPKNIEKFVSTLGQTTWYSSYAVLILPFGMAMFCTSKKIIYKLLAGAFVVLGSASLCTVNSDSAYVAVMLIIMVFFWYALENNKAFTIFLELVCIMLLSFRTVGILQDLFPERMITLISGDEKITKFVNHSSVMLILTIAVVLFYIVWRFVILKKYGDENSNHYFSISKLKFLRKIMIIAASLVIWLVAILIALATTHKLPSFLSSLYDVNFLIFDDLWGNCRGFNWRMAIRAFTHSSFKDFILGVGPDCFSSSMDKYCFFEVQAFWHGKRLSCAHNEWLNMLVTEGIFGLLAYLSIFITSATRLAKAAYKEPMAIPCLAAIVAYIGHNFFCYQQCLCTPTIFIIMGIGEITIREAAKND